MPSAWVARSGKRGERETWVLDNGYAGTGWSEFPDLSRYRSRNELAALVADKLPAGKEGAIANYTGQLWALSNRIEIGDLMVLPLKTTKEIALGRVAGKYKYLANEADPSRRHVVEVDWKVTDVPRSAVKQDLLFILGSALTVFAPSKHGAIARLEYLLEFGKDPGQVPFVGNGPPNATPPDSVLGEVVDEPEASPDIEEQSQTQIQTKLAEEFAGHGLADLVTALLEIEGFVCHKSLPGADGGVDIMAGRGLLGLDPPVLLVQVKSGSKVGSEVMQQLHGAMNQYGADQGLLVSWGGLSKAGQTQMQNAHMRVTLWEALDVIDAVLANYEKLPDAIREKVPLKQVWMLDDSGP
jgi:restriction system protein